MEHGWIISPTGTFDSPGTFTGTGILYGAFDNRSDFTIPSDTLEVIGSLDNVGTISGGGTLRVDNGRLQTSGTVGVNVRITNATLYPHDPPQVGPAGLPRMSAAPGRLALQGTIDPPLGHLHVSGDLTMSFSLGTIAIRIGSRASGLRDTIDVAGGAVLDGTLALTSIAGSEPMAGDTITVLEAGSVTGAFAQVLLDGEDPGSDVQVLYEPTAVKVVFASGTTAVDDPPNGTHSIQEVRFSASRGRGVTAFVLDLPAVSHVRVTMYDVTGREAARLVDGTLPVGHHQFPLPHAASGMYFARAEVDLDGRRVVRTARVPLLR